MKGNTTGGQPPVPVCADGAETPGCAFPTSFVEPPFDGNSDPRYSLLPNEDTDDDSVRWYPMRIYHSNAFRAMRLRDQLTQLGFTTYLRLEQREVMRRGELVDVMRPVLVNLVFIRTKKKILRELKRTEPDLHLLRFVVRPPRSSNERVRVIVIPDDAMRHFIDAETRPDPLGQRRQLVYDDYVQMPGRRVRVIRGPFVGLNGEVKRIGHRRMLVVKLEEIGIADAFLLDYHDLKLLDD